MRPATHRHFSSATDRQVGSAKTISEILGCDLSSVSVAIRDIEKEDWKEKVWDKNIVPDEKILYKKPGYSYD